MVEEPKSRRKRNMIGRSGTCGHGNTLYVSTQLPNRGRFSSTLNGRHLHWSVTRRGGQKEREKKKRWRGVTHRRDSGIVIASQQSHQHSLTARPNNQLRAENGSQQRRGENAWERQGRRVDPTALLWIPIQAFFPADSWQLRILFLPFLAMYTLQSI